MLNDLQTGFVIFSVLILALAASNRLSQLLTPGHFAGHKLTELKLTLTPLAFCLKIQTKLLHLMSLIAIYDLVRKSLYVAA